MADLNRVLLHGRLTSDPTVQFSQDGKAVVRFTVAVNGFKENSADFIRCVAFDKKADVIGKYFRKGSQIIVDGRIQTGSYENKNGDTVYTTDIFVNDFDFCGKKDDIAEDVPHREEPKHPNYNQGFVEIDESELDSGLPF